MIKAEATKAFEAFESIAPGLVKSIDFNEAIRSANDLRNQSIIGYHLRLTVFYDDTNFSVYAYEWDDDISQDYETLTKMAVEKLKQIANEKTR